MTHKTRASVLLVAVFSVAIALAPQISSAAQLTAETARAFDQYISAKEIRANRDLAAKRNFLFVDALPQTDKIPHTRD